jgi:hypothetical protein
MAAVVERDFEHARLLMQLDVRGSDLVGSHGNSILVNHAGADSRTGVGPVPSGGARRWKSATKPPW